MSTAKEDTKVRRISDAGLRKATKRGRDEWVEALDKAGARLLTYREIVALLKGRYRLKAFWQHEVAQNYEISIGRRLEGQNSKGLYGATVTKTVGATAAKAWRFATSAEGLAHWLRPLSPVEILVGAHFETDDGFVGQIRTLRKGERLRLRWQDPDDGTASTATLYVLRRPGTKCLLAIMHESIRTTALRERLRARWQRGLLEMKTRLEEN